MKKKEYSRRDKKLLPRLFKCFAFKLALNMMFLKFLCDCYCSSLIAKYDFENAGLIN